MTGTIYLDVYFLVNLAMDLILILSVRKILKLPARKGRMGAAALAGAVWACMALCLFGTSGGWTAAVTWLAGGGLMVFLAFRPGRIPEFLTALCTLWMVSAAAGGAMETLLPGNFSLGQLSVWALFAGAAGMYFGVCACVSFVKGHIQEQKNLYEVTMTYRGKKETVTALYDTGNQLYEPYGHEPVHVVTYEACRRLCSEISQVIYVPFQAVGTERGMLPAVRIDEMTIARDGKTVMRLERPWLAVTKTPLSSANRYAMLLHGEKRE